MMKWLCRPALDAHDGHATFKQAVVEPRGPATGLEHDPPASWRLRQRCNDRLSRRQRLRFVQDCSLTVENAHMRLFHRNVQACKMRSGPSPPGRVMRQLISKPTLGEAMDVNSIPNRSRGRCRVSIKIDPHKSGIRTCENSRRAAEASCAAPPLFRSREELRPAACI
jgi:hypothetical protein